MRGLKVHGTIKVELVRDGKVILSKENHNLFTTAGLNHLLDVVFGNSAPVTQVDPWYIGLIDNDPVPTILAADVLSGHTGWEEFTDYTATRKAWTDANASAGVKASSSVSTFSINADGEVYGIFVCSVGSGTTGTLMSEGAFTDPIAVASGDDLKVSYTIEASST